MKPVPASIDSKELRRSVLNHVTGSLITTRKMWFALCIAACDSQSQHATAMQLAHAFAVSLSDESRTVVACVQRYAGPTYDCTLVSDDMPPLGVRCSVEKRGCWLP